MLNDFEFVCQTFNLCISHVRNSGAPVVPLVLQCFYCLKSRPTFLFDCVKVLCFFGFYFLNVFLLFILDQVRLRLNVCERSFFTF